MGRGKKKCKGSAEWRAVEKKAAGSAGREKFKHRSVFQSHNGETGGTITPLEAAEPKLQSVKEWGTKKKKVQKGGGTKREKKKPHCGLSGTGGRKKPSQ